MANFGLFGGGLTLKALLENPDLQSPPVLNSSEKEKKENDVQFDASSAFLGPSLWDRTYDNTDINLEYMDLDEFLSENGIPVNLDPLSSPEMTNSRSPVHSPSAESNQSTVSTSVVSSPAQIVMGPPDPRSPTTPHSPQQSRSPVTPHSPQQSRSPAPPAAQAVLSKAVSSPPPSPNIVDFVVSNDDLALVNISGEENFDPRKRTFSEEELKPQPMIKKSRKIFVNEDSKDDKYWQRRKKNNVAAKRSRDARRIKENQIAMRAAFLEKENTALRVEMEQMKKENLRLKTSLAKYEPPSSS